MSIIHKPGRWKKITKVRIIIMTRKQRRKNPTPTEATMKMNIRTKAIPATIMPMNIATVNMPTGLTGFITIHRA
ncbi:MAG: hypothetical protein EAS52_14390 [Parapedobacter sp.]|nr:MAG: hypothetical protein EAS52_14390 [Parapedobacter sp.]